jgi:3-hydroxyisobutyrate dehydrogenase-like beta-hydroxyacid dehydrogenase
MRVAFLGLGIMGRSMATNLAKAGHEVTVWNRTPGQQVEGARAAATPAEAAQGAEVVWMAVSDTAAVETVLFGPDGVEPSLTEGMIVVDSSTISGTLLFMVGGEESVIERLKPLYAAMGKKLFHMGEVGKGQSTKLVMNLQIALIYEGFAEALTLAAKLGVDAEKLIPLVNASMVKSGVVEYKAPFVLARDFSANFPLRLMRKDIRLALDAAKEVRAKLPALETVEEVYDLAIEDGHADLDYAATLLLLEKWAGVEVKGEAA